MTPTCKKDIQEIYMLIAEAWEQTIVNNTKMKAIIKRNQPELLSTDEGKGFYFAAKDVINYNDTYVNMIEELMDEAATYLQEACAK